MTRDVVVVRNLLHLRFFVYTSIGDISASSVKTAAGRRIDWRWHISLLDQIGTQCDVRVRYWTRVQQQLGVWMGWALIERVGSRHFAKFTEVHHGYSI
jgi:hypothetical protein